MQVFSKLLNNLLNFHSCFEQFYLIFLKITSLVTGRDIEKWDDQRLNAGQLCKVGLTTHKVDSFNSSFSLYRVVKIFYKIEPAKKYLYHSICFSGKISRKEASFLYPASGISGKHTTVPSSL